jgi:hypothetical protein
VGSDALAQLHDDVSALTKLDVAALADGEAVVALLAEVERLQAVATRAVAAFDAGRSWEAEGARSAAAWLAAHTRQPVAALRRQVGLGRALRRMPATEAAWAAGEIGGAHATPLAAARRRVGGEAFDADEGSLVEAARTLRYDRFLAALAYWCQAADPEGAEDHAEGQRDRRRLHLSQSLGGSWFLDGVLDPVSGEIVAGALGRIEDELFRADWAEARERVGEGVGAEDLRRTPAQRRADALVELARRGGAVPAGARLPEPLITVVVGYETVAGRICELASRTVVTPGSLLPHLDQAWVERVVFDGPGRVIEVGARRRLFDGALRRAIEVRDRECYHPLCDVPAHRCQVDHVEPWAEGGPTTQANGRLACAFHNRLRHRGPRSGPDPPETRAQRS